MCSRPREHERVHPLPGGLEHRRRHVAQRGDRGVPLRDHGDGGLALRPTLVVGRGLEPARRARVAHDERHVVEREPDRAMLERAAVEEQGAPLLAERGRELVHQPAVDADVAVLGPLGRLRERHPVERRQRAPDERERRRELERCRARQARALRQVRREDAAEPAGRDAGIRERPGHARDVVDPRPGLGSDGVEVEGGPLAGRREGDLDPTIVRWDRARSRSPAGCRPGARSPRCSRCARRSG